jgi:hypothetical protein
MYQNKTIDEKNPGESKSRNRKEMEPDRRWRTRIAGERGGREEQLEPEEIIETDAATGKAALGNGITWIRKRESVVLKRTVG